MQLLRQVVGRHHVFLFVIKAAAVHGPKLSAHAFLAVGGGLQAVVEPNEVEGRADPGDAGDEMQPAQRKVQPGNEIHIHKFSRS